MIPCTLKTKAGDSFEKSVKIYKVAKQKTVVFIVNDMRTSNLKRYSGKRNKQSSNVIIHSVLHHISFVSVQTV
jgi:hypothetical protein